MIKTEEQVCAVMQNYFNIRKSILRYHFDVLYLNKKIDPILKSKL